MGLKGVIDTINMVANGATSVNSIKEVGKSIHNDVKKANMPPKVKPISIHAPANVKVGDPVTISGTGIGEINLYSANEHIRTLYCDRSGDWYAREYFSKPGTYKLTAKDNYGSAETTVQAE